MAALSPAALPGGCGIIRPFRRTERGDFASACGAPILASRIGQILGTDLGSLPFRPEFGSALFRLRHLPVDDTFGDLATSIVVEALGRWEPGLNVTSVFAEAPPSGGSGFVTLVVGYRVAGLSLQARIIV